MAQTLYFRATPGPIGFIRFDTKLSIGENRFREVLGIAELLVQRGAVVGDLALGLTVDEVAEFEEGQSTFDDAHRGKGHVPASGIASGTRCSRSNLLESSTSVGRALLPLAKWERNRDQSVGPGEHSEGGVVVFYWPRDDPDAWSRVGHIGVC